MASADTVFESLSLGGNTPSTKFQVGIKFVEILGVFSVSRR
jgi:hypothetical protein